MTTTKNWTLARHMIDNRTHKLASVTRLPGECNAVYTLEPRNEDSAATLSATAPALTGQTSSYRVPCFVHVALFSSTVH